MFCCCCFCFVLFCFFECKSYMPSLASGLKWLQAQRPWLNYESRWEQPAQGLAINVMSWLLCGETPLTNRGQRWARTELPCCACAFWERKVTAEALSLNQSRLLSLDPSSCPEDWGQTGKRLESMEICKEVDSGRVWEPRRPRGDQERWQKHNMELMNVAWVVCFII